MAMQSAEQKRIEEPEALPVRPWKKWGPYVSERAWGTVREDYSANGDAWNYFPFEHAQWKAYRWGEDAIAGWCDRYQVLLFAPVFWNGKDPILKERFFGLTSSEGNHGEDVKEYYFHLDAVPTHSYMKYLYKYPQDAYPYQKLRDENRNRSIQQSEYELVDTGIFNDNRYFDIFIEYAKAAPEDLCIRIEVFNRGKEEAEFHLLPHLWFRNQWAWGDKRQAEPEITNGRPAQGAICITADDREMASPLTIAFDYHLGKRHLYGPAEGKALFTNNETHVSDQIGYFKDAFHKAIIQGEKSVNPDGVGTKACLHYKEMIPGGKSKVFYFRFTNEELKDPLKDVEAIVSKRKEEANAFYAEIQPPKATEEEKKIQRQAIAGILWSQQIYLYDVNLWLKGDNTILPPPASRLEIRNVHWRHLNSMRVMIMPDKWEYPWFAAWDHCFHCLTAALVDIELAKEQLWLLLFDQFQHPNGQIPAYEWEFSDLNPPVQAWAVFHIFMMERERFGRDDRKFLERCFHKLLINFAWWVNKVDSSGNNVFEGGFLGLDNITVLDRSQVLPGGAKLEQSDGTGWMARFCLNLMRIALELSKKDDVYESLATKFFEHYVYIGAAMKKRGNQNYEMWSDRDGFFYDVLTYPDGKFAKFRVRSLVGIIPLYAAEVLKEETIKNFPEFYRNFSWFLENRKDLVESCVIPVTKEGKKHYVMALMNQHQLTSVLKYVWAPSEFRSDFGLRSLSKIHQEHPFVFEGKSVGYEPAESLAKVKGGNSNWRGPVWVPTTYLLVHALQRLSGAFEKKIEVTAGEEEAVDLQQMSASFGNRIIDIFKKNAEGERPCWGAQFPFRQDPYWCDHLLFNEYYHGETGQGLGASHQTGWSALVANLIDELRR